MGRDGISKFIFCPMAEPDIGQRERELITASVIENQIGSQGRFIKEFEGAWAFRNAYAHGVSCNSGTSALHLAIKASGAKRILMPNFTMAGTVWPAMYDGLDITYLPTRADLPLAELPESVEGYDAIVFAHIFGRRAYPEGWVTKLKKQYPNLIVIDDMAEAHGIMPEGDIACYSFYANKILTTGEGGMCLTNSQALADEMRSLANMYFDKERTMVHPKVGYNYRMTNIQAAIGVGQEERLDQIIEKRKKIEAWYNKYLPEEMRLPQREVLWFYDCRVKNADKMKKRLKSRGVDSRRFFYPMSLQPWGNQMPDPAALKWYKQGLLLPVYNTMVEGDVKYIVDTLLGKTS